MTCYKYIKRCITLMISNGMICLVWLQIKLEDTHWSYPKRGVTLLNGYIHFHFVLWISGIACHRKQFLQEQLTLLGHIWMIQIGMWKNSIQRSAQLSILKVALCYRFSCYYRFSDIAINSVNPSFIIYDDWNFQWMAS